MYVGVCMYVKYMLNVCAYTLCGEVLLHDPRYVLYSNTAEPR